MPYFLILPAFVLYVAGMGAALALTWVYQPARPFRRYIASVLLWSSIGFILSTVVYAVVLVVSVRVMDQALNGQPSTAGGIVMAAILFVGPLLASAAGLGGGAAIGVWRTRSRPRQAGELRRGAG